MDTPAVGIITLVVGGVLNGTFAFPMKRVVGWQWENIWFLFGVFGLLLFPWLAAWLWAGNLLAIYSLAALPTLVAVLLLGVAWGIGSVLFGRGIAALGVSLGFSIVMGATAVFGTLVPALSLEPGIFSTGRGLKLAGSLILIAGGLALCAIAGRKRDRQRSCESECADFQILSRTAFQKGIAICLLSGVLSACFNIGFATTAGITRAAERVGAPPLGGSFAVWALIMSGGFLPNLAYCAHLFRRNRSVRLLGSGGWNWLWAILMSTLWIMALAFYSAGAQQAGSLGATVGWPIMVASSIVGANVLGLLTGEWRGAKRDVTGCLYGGLATLLAAVVVAGSARVV